MQSKPIRTEKGRESFESKSNEVDADSNQNQRTFDLKQKNIRETIIVDWEGTGDYITIQEGIDGAEDGDLVLVYPGTYVENINYNGKNITVASKYYTTGDESYINCTIIDGNHNGSCVTVCNGEIDTEICGFTIQHGSGTMWISDTAGGGIFLIEVKIDINNCILKNNITSMGAGIHSWESEIELKGTRIFNNYSHFGGGGIYLRSENDVTFDMSDRCDIYLNYAPFGSDICTNWNGNLEIIVDTFTVLEPDKFYTAGHIEEDTFIYNILHSKIEQVNNDLYISPDGDNNNGGLTPDDPLQNIYNALIKIESDSTHPNTIHLSEGFYSPSTTGEFFALGGKEYISIIGAGQEETIIDAEQTYKLFTLKNIENVSIQKLTLQHGLQLNTGGMSIDGSNAIIKNVNFLDNISINGVCESHINIFNCSNPIFDNVDILTTSEQVNSRAIFSGSESIPLFFNCTIKGNHTNPEMGNFGAGSCINSCPIFINTLIADNSADICSGFAALWSIENIYFINCTIVDNGSCSEGTIRLVDDSHVTLINTILRNDPYTEIYFFPQHEANSATIKYCNIEGGSSAVAINNNGILNWGLGNIDEDPMFEGGEPYSYELTENSPCIDAGTPDTTGLNLPELDLGGNPRIYNGRIDIGAYEYQGYGVNNPDTSFINKLYLFQNQPNPFKEETEILFITSDYERVEDYQLSIYNVRGQLVKRYNGEKDDFWVKTKIVWDGKDRNGNEVSPGTYFYKLEYGKDAVVRKMVKFE